MMWVILFSGITGMHVDSLGCVRVKNGESECFRISGVRHECIMSLSLFNVYMNALMKDVKMGMGRRGERVEIAWPLV